MDQFLTLTVKGKIQQLKVDKKGYAYYYCSKNNAVNIHSHLDYEVAITTKLSEFLISLGPNLGIHPLEKYLYDIDSEILSSNTTFSIIGGSSSFSCDDLEKNSLEDNIQEKHIFLISFSVSIK